MIALQRKVFARSNIRILMVNKESLGYDAQINKTSSQYNRNLGAEFNLASANNIWTGKATVLKSFTHISGNDVAISSLLNFNRANFFWQLRHEFVGENYNAEVGYVPNAARRGYQMAVPNVGYLFFVNSTKLISHGPLLQSTFFGINQAI